MIYMHIFCFPLVGYITKYVQHATLGKMWSCWKIQREYVCFGGEFWNNDTIAIVYVEAIIFLKVILQWGVK